MRNQQIFHDSNIFAFLHKEKQQIFSWQQHFAFLHMAKQPNFLMTAIFFIFTHGKTTKLFNDSNILHFDTKQKSKQLLNGFKNIIHVQTNTIQTIKCKRINPFMLTKKDLDKISFVPKRITLKPDSTCLRNS